MIKWRGGGGKVRSVCVWAEEGVIGYVILTDKG